MAKTALTRAEKATLRKARPGAMPYVLGSIRRYLRQGRWLGTTNRYEGDRLARLRLDVKNKNLRVRHLRQYAAAAALRHVLDGWSYLGSSLYAMSRGDSDHSLHLGYYASLRAAESVLATQAIAILDRQHFVVDGLGGVERVGKEDAGTHVISWLGLDHWAGLDRSGDAIAAVVRPGGIPLPVWLQAGFGGRKWGRVAARWMTSWGTDLKEMAEDRERRNRASYQPGGRGVPTPSPILTVSYLREVWRALEPSSYSPFDRLDRHLMRRAFETVLFETTSPPRTIKQRASAVDRLLSNMTYLPIGIDWRRFLMRQDDPDDLVVLERAAESAPNTSTEHLSVTARSLLLLRVATGLSARLRTVSAVTDSELAFWWKPLAQDRGLVDPARPPGQARDMWADVDLALASVAIWMATAKSTDSFRSMNTAVSDSLHELAGTERAGVWGMEL